MAITCWKRDEKTVRPSRAGPLGGKRCDAGIREDRSREIDASGKILRENGTTVSLDRRATDDE